MMLRAVTLLAVLLQAGAQSETTSPGRYAHCAVVFADQMIVYGGRGFRSNSNVLTTMGCARAASRSAWTWVGGTLRPGRSFGTCHCPVAPAPASRPPARALTSFLPPTPFTGTPGPSTSAVRSGASCCRRLIRPGQSRIHGRATRACSSTSKAHLAVARPTCSSSAECASRAPTSTPRS